MTTSSTRPEFLLQFRLECFSATYDKGLTFSPICGHVSLAAFHLQAFHCHEAKLMFEISPRKEIPINCDYKRN